MDRFWQVLFVFNGLSPSGRLVVKRLSEMGHRVFFGACPSVNAETVDTALVTALPLKLWDDNSGAQPRSKIISMKQWLAWSACKTHFTAFISAGFVMANCPDYRPNTGRTTLSEGCNCYKLRIGLPAIIASTASRVSR